MRLSLSHSIPSHLISASSENETSQTDDVPANSKESSDTAIEPVDAYDENMSEEEETAEASGPEPAAFAALGLSEPILRALAASGYTQPTPIQTQAIPQLLMGRDLVGIAQTGTGKTAGFTLPMLEILSTGRAKMRMPRSLILEPTRELAQQVAASFDRYGKHLRLAMALLIGGESMEEQMKQLDRGVDVLIATPGRLMDLFERGKILLTDIKIFVIDEADRMMDMGFIPDIEKIASMLPRIRQTMLFSATMPDEIRRLSQKFLSSPKEISVAPPSTPAATVAQHLVLVSAEDKRHALRQILRQEEVANAFIFCNRKRDVDVLLKSLTQHGFKAGALHGDMAQSKRSETLDGFKRGAFPLLVCSDVAARGLDVAGLSHVFNFDIPFNAEDYIHRIGRTGRAGKSGVAYSFADPDEMKCVEAIELLIKKALPRLEIAGVPTPDLAVLANEAENRLSRRGQSEGGRGGSRAGGGRGSRGGAALKQHVGSTHGKQQGGVVAKHPVARFHADTRAAGSLSSENSRDEMRTAQPSKHTAEPPADRRDGANRAAPKAAPKAAPQPASQSTSQTTSHLADSPSPRGFGDDLPAFLRPRSR